MYSLYLHEPAWPLTHFYYRIDSNGKPLLYPAILLAVACEQAHILWDFKPSCKHFAHPWALRADIYHESASKPCRRASNTGTQSPGVVCLYK